jgi:hypothetical protein
MPIDPLPFGIEGGQYTMKKFNDDLINNRYEENHEA